MDHLDQDALAAAQNTAAQQVEVGARYAHYKHPNDQFYTVTGVGLLEANNEPAVIYKAEYGANITYIRPLAVWSEMVDVGGRQVPRFSKVA